MSFREVAAAAEHAREFWGKRYKDFSLSESGWMGAGERYNEYLYECKRQALMRTLAQIGLNKNSSLNVLDAGCGQGFFAGVWQASFPNASYTGVDICGKVVTHLKDKFPRGKFFTGDLATWQHPQGKKFDVIHSFEVLHLLLSDAAVENAVFNLSAQLKPGGHLLLTAALPSATVEPNDYIRHQGRDFWEITFRKAGLEMASNNRIYYWLPDGGPKSRLASKILRLPGPGLLYLLDRFAHRVALPQMFGGWDSRMKLLILSKTNSSFSK
jgi:SAM-dependent methyltransferase